MEFECFFCQITVCTFEIQWFDRKKIYVFWNLRNPILTTYHLDLSRTKTDVSCLISYHFSVKLPNYALLKFFGNNFCLLFQKAKKPNFDDISFEIRPEVDKSAVSDSPATVTTTIPTKNNDKNNPESTATALSNNTSATAAGKDSKDKVNLLVS